jgi:PAS domain S-box-containing protein
MQRPQSETVTLNDILITEELSQRAPRPPNLLSENQALHTLARQLVNQPETMLQSLIDIALDLCCAETAGVSLLETTPNGEEIFRWNVLAGTLAQYVGGTTPRNFSPCGTCLDRGTPVLFSHPDRYFTYLQSAKVPIVEALVLPLIADRHALGTIWILSHDEQRHFDLEDVRLMTLLADFAAAHLLNQRQTQQLLAANAKLETLESTTIKQLRESEEKYRTLFNSMDEGYCVIEMHIEPGEPLDYRFIETNQAFEQQSTLINAQGKWMRELRPNHEESWFEIYRNVALTGEPIRFEHGGRELGDRWFTLYAFRVGQPDERRVAILFNDITERKQAEAALRAFFSNVSHEFRTPLTLLMSSIQDTLSDRAHPLTPAQQSQLQLAHRNAIRLLKLVNTLLDFSRIEAGRIRAVYEPTDLATLTIELASAFESAAEQAGLRLVIDCPPLRSPVYVDRSMWEKIVLNLLSNAFKFTFAGEIAVRLTLVGDRVELTVQDTGIGIAAA